MIKLIQNFRSHRDILEYPNTKFYNGDLKDCGDPKVINAYLHWPRLPKQGFPIIFHAVQGRDDREASSPSFFNIDEVLQVSDYVKLLRNDRHIRISAFLASRFVTILILKTTSADHDIGIVAPYHAQVLKIRNKLRTEAAGVKIGSVEEFQGQERRVIIISTVRSSREFVEYDLRHTLGFVANPRRFNGGFPVNTSPRCSNDSL
jgi:helicase MOV-10